MNFFEAQYDAKKKTNRLLFLFLFVLLLTSLIIGGVFSFSYTTINISKKQNKPVKYGRQRIERIDLSEILSDEMFQKTFMITFLSVFGFIGIISLFKVLMLRSNPDSICTSMGAFLVLPNEKRPLMKQYVNIVEEMSIASGIPVPKIYFLTDSSINAFACGYDIHNAAVCVTRGAIENLTRDELQAVVAHEFSHILNGDMNVNLKLTGAVAGLIALFQIGRVVIRATSHGSSRKNGGGPAVIGIALFVVGGLGFLLASWIKSMISQEREYLADASSVQFTRNPDAMVGVLFKIMANVQGSILHSDKVDDASHMCIADPTKGLFNFNTHPPLEKRIKAINKNIKINDSELERIKKEMYEMQRQKEKTFSVKKEETKKDKNKQMEDKVKGVMTHMLPMFMFLQKLPKPMNGSEHSISEMLIPFMQNNMDEIKNLNADTKIKYLEMLTPHVRNLSQAEKDKLKSDLLAEIKKDGKIDFMEFLIFGYLKPALESDSMPLKNLSESDYLSNAQLLLSFVYYNGGKAQKEFSEIIKPILNVSLAAKKEVGYTKIIEALSKLRFCAAMDKQKLCQAVKEIIVHDAKITDREKLIFNLITQSIGVPGIALKDL